MSLCDGKSNNILLHFIYWSTKWPQREAEDCFVSLHLLICLFAVKCNLYIWLMRRSCAMFSRSDPTETGILLHIQLLWKHRTWLAFVCSGEVWYTACCLVCSSPHSFESFLGNNQSTSWEKKDLQYSIVVGARSERSAVCVSRAHILQVSN